MKVQLEIEIKPFTVPNFVVAVEEPKPRQEGFKSSEGIPLSALDSKTLDKLCEDFRDAVFQKAGKEQPDVAVCACGAR